MALVNQTKMIDPNDAKPPVLEDLGYANFE
jgi:hypothetical protein